MNRDTARAIERQALALLAPMESDGQLKIAAKGGTIGKTFVNLKIEFAEVGESGVVESREVADFKALAKLYGLSADDLGKQFVSRGERYEIVGLKPKSHKFPILGQNRNGKVYKFPAESVKQGLESVTAAPRPSPTKRTNHRQADS
jgi:hypothetical protein